MATDIDSALGTAAAPPGEPAPDAPIRIREITAEGTLTILGAAAAALALCWVLYERVLPFTGVLGFWLCWYGLFLLCYAGVASLQWNRLAVRDRVVSVGLTTAGLLATALVIDQVGYTLVRGLTVVNRTSFFTESMVNTAALSPISSGGIGHALVGTLEQLTLATLLSVPLGIAAALYLAEVGGPGARPVRTLVDAMTALPDIIAGLFVLAFFVLTVGLPKSGFAAAIALAVTMLPIVTRASETVLRIVPGTLREASYALGGSQWRTVLMVVLPTARSGLATAVVLGMARGIGETAPVLLVSGYSNAYNWNPFNGWQTSLPLYIYNEIQKPELADHARAFGGGFALIALVLVLFTIARRLGGGAPGELTRRQRRKLERQAAQRVAALRLAPPTGRTGR
ncbi:phosphate ABC transporter permease PstA [Trebonia kvetii]|uniref:Phosphate transport system permease protein PstA n=1 Tax=Trebonia kvetii TaxID=2480626 RepID=A0A6P2CCF4_9ACTN|nr:phosphate ABC transporter permease PstA [Trebonia kvetii]TVZ07253.1 phosphate ABC transporter permease PstA [Trebonia kvetii]